MSLLRSELRSELWSELRSELWSELRSELWSELRFELGSDNPKVKKFMEEHPEQTMLGFAWSCYWRLYVVILGIVFTLGILSTL